MWNASEDHSLHAANCECYSKTCAIARRPMWRAFLITCPTKNKERQIALPPFPQSRENNYFRLVIAVRSAESLTIPAAPHQLEPAPPGLIDVTLVVPEALKALVKALQLPFDRSESE